MVTGTSERNMLAESVHKHGSLKVKARLTISAHNNKSRERIELTRLLWVSCVCSKHIYKSESQPPEGLNKPRHNIKNSRVPMRRKDGSVARNVRPLLKLQCGDRLRGSLSGTC